MRNVTRAVMLVLVGLLLSPVPSAAAAPRGVPYAPLVQGWEQFFKVTWQPLERNGRSYVDGTVVNDWGFTARRVQLLIDGLDSSGQIVSQKVSWLGQDLTPGSRGSFDIPAPQPAVSYRVSVFAFDWVQTVSIQTP